MRRVGPVSSETGAARNGGGVLGRIWLAAVGAAALAPSPAQAADLADAGGVSPILLLLVLLALLPLLLWARHRLRQLEGECARLEIEIAREQAERGALPAARYRWAADGSESFEPGPVEALADGTEGFRKVLLCFVAPDAAAIEAGVAKLRGEGTGFALSAALTAGGRLDVIGRRAPRPPPGARRAADAGLAPSRRHARAHRGEPGLCPGHGGERQRGGRRASRDRRTGAGRSRPRARGARAPDPDGAVREPSHRGGRPAPVHGVHGAADRRRPGGARLRPRLHRPGDDPGGARAPCRRARRGAGERRGCGRHLQRGDAPQLLQLGLRPALAARGGLARGGADARGAAGAAP